MVYHIHLQLVLAVQMQLLELHLLSVAQPRFFLQLVEAKGATTQLLAAMEGLLVVVGEVVVRVDQVALLCQPICCLQYQDILVVMLVVMGIKMAIAIMLCLAVVEGLVLLELQAQVQDQALVETEHIKFLGGDQR